MFFNNISSITLKIIVEIRVPELLSLEEYDSWISNLLQSDFKKLSKYNQCLDSLSSQDKIFVGSVLGVSRLFLELGGLPIFDVPRITSLRCHAKDSKTLILEIETFEVDFVPKVTYELAFKSAIEICQWIAKSSLTEENKAKVFETISEEVIKPLHRLVPSGKSTVPILRVAHSLGIPFIHLGIGVYQLGWGSKSRRLDRSVSELDSAIGSKLAQNKVATANLIRSAGLPSALHGVAANEREASAIAKEIGFPVVVKPIDRDRGEGVTVNIFDQTGLATAFLGAQKLSKSALVIVERQVQGTCHRLFIANEKLLYAVKRNPMSIVGDGKKSVKNLVEECVSRDSQIPPWYRSGIKPLDGLALKSIKELGMAPESIPKHGERVHLRPIESTEWGGVDEDVTNIVNAENLDIALQAAKLFGLSIAGIDIITPDITRPWYETGAIINEVNFAPLFGGAEISRSYIPKFFSDFIDGDGKIPIEVFDTEQAALVFQKEQIALGKRCWLITKHKTLNEFCKHVAMSIPSIPGRIKALVLRSDIDAISVVINN